MRGLPSPILNHASHLGLAFVVLPGTPSLSSTSHFSYPTVLDWLLFSQAFAHQHGFPVFPGLSALRKLLSFPILVRKLPQKQISPCCSQVSDVQGWSAKIAQLCPQALDLDLKVCLFTFDLLRRWFFSSCLF